MSNILLKKLKIFEKKSKSLFTRAVDNDTMAKKRVVSVQKGIRFPRWMHDKIQKIADKGDHTFTDVVLDLLRQELAHMGYTMGIGREATGDSEKEPADKQDVG
jgi:hypothetical protein